MDAGPPARPVDLVLAGGGVLGIAHVGVVSVLEEHGYHFERIGGTSAGAIVGSLLAAGASAAELHEIITGLDYGRFLDKDALDRVPLAGPPLSVLLENGYAEGRYFADWLTAELAARGKTTFADLRRTDAGDDPRPEQRWRLAVMAADVTRGQFLRLPWDYGRYDLDPDAQPIAGAVRASISVPYLFEPARLRHGKNESLLVDGGLISNYPLEVFDRTDGARPRWPTFGVTLIRPLPAGDTRLVPGLRALRLVPSFRFLESLVTTAVVGRDQGYLAQPWVHARSIEVDSLGVNPFDFTIGPDVVARLYESGRAAATEFLARWSFEDYLERCRRGAAGSVPR
ncbi:MAG TPA: patatin-like phospholipase family protein [Solirubrobacteraceae bacterium]